MQTQGYCLLDGHSAIDRSHLLPWVMVMWKVCYIQKYGSVLLLQRHIQQKKQYPFSI